MDIFDASSLTTATNTCQAHPTFSASPVPPPELISVVWSPRILSTFTLVTRRFPIP